MDIKELNELLALAERATRGPWYANVAEYECGVDGSGFTRSVYYMTIGPHDEDSADCFMYGDSGDEVTDQQEADFEFVAKARTRFPAVVQDCVRLLAENERLSAQLRECHELLNDLSFNGKKIPLSTVWAAAELLLKKHGQREPTR